ncbi:DsbA family oxidoreductase [Luteimonas salinilitoris]|uniref:DsbA family oxidoreductase n=1 Tax=Luteimonas salinilitoris TaxID=3237697 RepID=A0ABV4HVW5_9GAMM
MNATATGGVPLRIDFVSDVVCPWCAIGLASLEQALERTRGEVQAELHFRPFELNPQLPPEGEDIAGHLQKKYGLSPAQLAESHERIRQRGAELGFTFAADRRRIYNTFDAHRLLHWAALEGSQIALKHALLRAYFTDGQNVSNHDTLVRIAGGTGLAPDRAREILASDTYASEVRAEEQLHRQNGINAVPAIIIDQQHLISGGQPMEVFERALRQIATAKTG